MSNIRIRKLKSGNYAVYEGRSKVQEGLLGRLTSWAFVSGHHSYLMLYSELMREIRNKSDQKKK